MKKLIVLLALSVFGSAQAASVLIDFEEFSIGDGAGSIVTSSSPILTSQGYELSGGGSPGGDPFMSAEVFTGTNTGSTNAYGGMVSGFGQDGGNFAAVVKLEKADGGAFAIHSLDLFMETDPEGSTSIRGILADTGLATILTGVTVGTGDWLNLRSVTFRAQGNGFGFGSGAVEVDNIALSVVPIPAAVWLFGSALMALGWLRKKAVA